MPDNPSPAWTTADKLAWEDRAICDHRLLPIERVVAAYLRGKYNAAKGGAYPSHKTIAAKLGVSERTVWGALKRLEALGYIKRRRRGRGRTDLCQLVMPPDEAPKSRSPLRVLDPQPAAAPPPQPTATPEPQGVAIDSIEVEACEVSPDEAASSGQQLHDSSLRDRSNGYPVDAVEQLKRRYPEALRHLKADGLWQSVLAFKGMGLLWPELLSVLAEGLPHLAAGKVRTDLFGTFEGNAQEAISRREHAANVEAAWAAAPQEPADDPTEEHRAQRWSA